MTPRRRRGFTLVELIVAVALTSVAALAAGTLISGVLSAQRRGEAAATVVNDLRSAAALFERDVRCADAVAITADGARLGGAVWRLEGARLLRRSRDIDEVVLRGVQAFRIAQDDATLGGNVRAEIALAPVAGESRGPAVVATARPRAGGAR